MKANVTREYSLTATYYIVVSITRTVTLSSTQAYDGHFRHNTCRRGWYHRARPVGRSSARIGSTMGTLAISHCWLAGRAGPLVGRNVLWYAPLLYFRTRPFMSPFSLSLLGVSRTQQVRNGGCVSCWPFVWSHCPTLDRFAAARQGCSRLGVLSVFQEFLRTTQDHALDDGDL